MKFTILIQKITAREVVSGKSHYLQYCMLPNMWPLTKLVCAPDSPTPVLGTETFTSA